MGVIVRKMKFSKQKENEQKLKKFLKQNKDINGKSKL